MQKCLKLAGLRSQKDVKKAQVRGHRKMPKSHRSANMEKCQKLSGPRSRKNTKKMLRSAVMHKCQKLAWPLSRNDIKNAKNSQVRGHGKIEKMLRSAFMKCLTRRSVVTKKYQRVARPRSQKYAKKSQVRGHGKWRKGRRYAIVDKCQKLASLRSRKNRKNA